MNTATLRTDRTQLLVTIPYVANGTVEKWSPDIPLFTYDYFSLQLANGVLNKAGGSSFGTVAPLGNPALVKNIEVGVNGRTIKKYSVADLCEISGRFFRGVQCNMGSMVTAANANDPISFNIPLDFQMPRARLAAGPTNPNNLKGPELCLLRGKDFDNMNVRVDWGNHTNLIYGSTNYTTFAVDPATSLKIYGHIIDDPVLNNPLRQQFLTHKNLPKQVSVTATTTEMETKLPANGRDSYAYIAISQFTDDGAGAFLPSTSIIVPTGRIQLWINNQSEKKIDTTWQALRDQNLLDYGIAQDTGFVILDFMPDGRYEGALRADSLAGVQSVEILTDVVTATNAKLRFNLGMLTPP
jgi:hypothetical protein